MKLRRVMSALLVGAMAAALLAGCGGGTSADTATADGSAAGEAEASTEVSAEAEETEEAGYAFQGFDELQTISMYVMSFYGDNGYEEVEAAINEISVPLINVQIEYHDLDMATYMEQVGLMLAGGETMDLVEVTAIPVVSFSTMTSQSELLDLTPYLDEYAPEMKEMMADYLPSCTIDGKIYAIPGYRMYAGGEYVAMRKDICEALDLVDEAEAVDSWSDLEALMLTVKDRIGELDQDLQVNAMIGNLDTIGDIITNRYCEVSADDWADNYGFDGLGDTNGMLYVDENGQVANYFATDEFRAICERMGQWNSEGLIYKDAATAQESSATLFGTGVTFAQIISAEYGAETAKVAEMVNPFILKKVCDIPVQAATANMWDWAVSVTSENPEAAVAFLNLMYTNADIENLFAYGIEGRDYELNEDGEAVILDDYQYMASDFSYGNQFNAYPLAGTGATYREDALAFEQSAEISDYIGLVVDTQPIANELTAVSNVLTQYKPALVCGDADISTLDTMLEAMDAAGMQTIIDYYQEALDAYNAQ